MKNKVGIITWHYYENVGSNLQAYALTTAVQSVGYDCTFINYQYQKFQDNIVKKVIKKICMSIDKIFPNILPEKYRFKSLQFQNKYFKCTKKILDKKELNSVNNDFDIFIAGSDQIWSPIVFDEVYFLNFVKKEKYKFSYAPSIGTNYLPNNLQETYKTLVNSFNKVSIREKQGQELLEEINIKANIVLDPSLLLSIQEWRKIEAKLPTQEKYIFCYFLGENYKVRQKIQEFAKEKQWKLIIYSANKRDKDYCNRHIEKMGPEEFIAYIDNAEYIFTDSFHGVAMSLKFEKQFYCFLRFEENDLKNQNSRIFNILSIVGLENRLISADNIKIEQKLIEYKNVNDKLNANIEESKQYLFTNLNKGSKK